MNTAETRPSANALGAAPAASRAATTSAAPEPAAHSSGVPASLGASRSAPAATRASTTATFPADRGTRLSRGRLPATNGNHPHCAHNCQGCKLQ